MAKKRLKKTKKKTRSGGRKAGILIHQPP